MKKTLSLRKSFWLALLSFAMLIPLTGCDEDEDCPSCPESVCMTTKGALVLNEGLFNANNASLSHYSYNCLDVTQNFFMEKIGRLLGDTGNDILLVDDRLYIVVNNSNRVEVVDINDWSSIASIEMVKDTFGSSPREIVEYNGKLFVTNFNGYMAVIDTANNYQNPIQWIEVDPSSEGLAIANNKLYVANSNYDFINSQANPGSINIINPVTLTVEDTIENIGVNISQIAADAYGDLYIVSRGNYADITPSLELFNTSTNTVDSTFEMDAQLIRISGDKAYVSVGGYDFTAGAFVSEIAKMDVKADTMITDVLIGSSNFQSLYGINIEPETGDIYCTDSKDFTVSGDVICFDKSGTKKFEFKAGINPSEVVFYNK